MLSSASAVRLTFSIESTVTVICESSIFSAVKLPCFSVLDDLAEAGAVGGQRDVDVLVEVLGGQAAAGSGRGGLVRRHADDAEIMIFADADRLADGIAIREELLGDLGTQHGDVGRGRTSRRR